ncbi:Retrovirus-related Pol polyprotein from transposon RE1 [Vitis vinifera]|uniref:Retrovirus-related Pol polyprotein from transposon RE1 n=1 Tax=Vitis vinifera TaxID=29760 RepID=A0A438I5X4_VITVI|nr:Retrovirus-related Pol polyprotein from transposon RE1 [Vitis vinifera]
MTDAHHLFSTYSPCAGPIIGETIGSAKEREGLYYFDEANVVDVSPTVCNSASSLGKRTLELRGRYEIQTNRETLYSRRPKSKSNETLTSEALKESEPVIVPTPQESGSNLIRIQIPKNIQEALEIPEWREAVMEEIRALEKNGTWEVMTLPRGKKPVGCKWVFTVKYKADGTVEQYKARLVAKGKPDWPLHQFDIKNAFLNGELEEEVFMMLPPGFCKEEEETRIPTGTRIIHVLQTVQRWKDDHPNRVCDDIILTRDNIGEVERLKVLATKFEVKDLGQMWYFLGMERYPYQARKRMESDGKPLDRERYRRLLGRLIYLSHTRLDIAFAVSVVSQYMHSPKESHLEAVYKILRYLKGSLGRGLFFKKGDSKKVRSIQMRIERDQQKTEGLYRLLYLCLGKSSNMEK